MFVSYFHEEANSEGMRASEQESAQPSQGSRTQCEVRKVSTRKSFGTQSKE